MAATRTANAHWEGSLFEGKGRVSLDSSGVGAYDVSWPARTEEPNGMTSPEELIAAAHSSCFSMAFSNELTKAGHTVETIDTKAEVTFEPGKGITGSHLTSRASVPGISEERRPDRHHDHPRRHPRLTAAPSAQQPGRQEEGVSACTAASYRCGKRCTSCGQPTATAIRPAQYRAWSSSGTSTTAKPPRCSLVST